jgi:hypothetical protein
MNNDDFIREFERLQNVRGRNLRLNIDQPVLPVRERQIPQQVSTPFRMEHFFVRQLLGEDIETGGNIRLHQDWIEPVLKHNPEGKPIMFRIDNNQKNVFCGINGWHTFNDPDCDNRIVYLPKWMMVHLGLKSNDIVRLVPMQIPSGKYVKLRSFTELVTMDFQKEYLESQLKQFTCLTKGQELMFGDHPVFVVDVGIDQNTKSIYDTICIINTDLEVDFDEPIDYTPPPPVSVPVPVPEPEQEPELKGKGLILGSSTHSTPVPVPEPKKEGFKAFAGQGYRLSDK